jgi:hypothetical protein
MQNASNSPDVTQLLLAWSNGDQRALEQLVPIVYRELRRLAKRYTEHAQGTRCRRPRS